jgi:hypothetical protein
MTGLRHPSKEAAVAASIWPTIHTERDDRTGSGVEQLRQR